MKATPFPADASASSPAGESNHQQRHTPAATRANSSRADAWLGLACALLPLLAGCGATELQDEYGRRNGPNVFASVNGTAVFADICEARGHTVFSWPVLSPRLKQRADVIVWFPDNFEPPGQDVQNWLQRWLKARPDRTLVYVGRHFSAVPWYWENVDAGSLPAKQRSEIGVRRKKARREFGQKLKSLPKSIEHDWFKLDGRHRHRDVRTLEGKAGWLRGIEPAKLRVELNTRMQPPPEAEVLLQSKGDAIVFRLPFNQSELIVVQNGSFLLNAPLSIPEHRRLAGKLIDEFGPPEKTVAFLEFRPHGPKIADKDPSFGPRLGFEIFHIWPTNWILLHVCLLAVLYCFWRFPIFGRPKEPRSESTSDFGSHIDAVARLLAKTGNSAYAHTRLQHYRQTARIDTGPFIPQAGDDPPEKTETRKSESPAEPSDPDT